MKTQTNNLSTRPISRMQARNQGRGDSIIRLHPRIPYYIMPTVIGRVFNMTGSRSHQQKDPPDCESCIEAYVYFNINSVACCTRTL